VEQEEKAMGLRKRVRGLWRRKIRKPWRRWFGRRESWIGTFYLR
jgi:hypothetical protein